MAGYMIVSLQLSSPKRPIRGYMSRSFTIKTDLRFWEIRAKGLKILRN
jgi:hypothetical protein